MAYVAVDGNSDEYIYDVEPCRNIFEWHLGAECLELPKGSVEKLIGRKLTWADEPVKLEEE